MRKQTRRARPVLSFEGLDQRIAPSGFVAAPTDTTSAETSFVGTPKPLPPPPPPKP